MDQDVVALLVYGLVFAVIAVLMVVVMGVVLLIGWILVSFFRLIAKFFYAYRDGHALSTWPAMFFYLVAPTGVILLGTWLAKSLQTGSLASGIEVTQVTQSGNAWMTALAVTVMLCVIAIHISAAGVYLLSFSWPHLAYIEQGFNTKMTLLVGMLFLEAFLVFPMMMRAIGL